MPLGRTTIAAACAALALASTLTTQPASARWVFHDDAVGEEIVAPPGGTQAQTCAHRLRATAGYGHFIDVANGEDPAAFEVPPDALRGISYEVWKAPRGLDGFSGAQVDDGGQVYFLNPDGSRRLATLVASLTTRPRAVRSTPVPSGGNPHVSDNFVFATAPIRTPLRGVAPGDRLGLIPVGGGGGIFVGVTAMNCRRPLVAARLDLRPGSRADEVRPGRPNALVPVRIFGSARLSVRRIRTVHLGEAAPAVVPPARRPSLRPRDVNRDGRLDRLYYFRQGDTDIGCIDAAATLTGQTTDRKRFQGRSRIATVGCDG